MNKEFYFIAAISFLLIPLILGVLTLLPFLLPQYSFIYFYIKPIGQQLFQDKQTLWGYIGILSAGIGIFLGFLYKDFQDKSKFRILINSLYYEILRDIELIFSGEVERPYVFSAFEKIYQEYSDKIESVEKFEPIRIIYDQLYYYREIVKIWRPSNPGDIVTERQFGVCNVILEFFEGVGINPNVNIPHNKWQTLRSQAIDKKNQELNHWKTKLKRELESIFKVKL